MKNLILIPILATLLVGCGSELPGCADEKAVTAVKGLITDQVKQKTNNFELWMFTDRPDDKNKKVSTATIEPILQTIKLDLSRITTEGSNEKAKARACRGQLALKILGNKTETEIEYTLQSLEDKKDDFLVEINEGRRIINHLSNRAYDYLKEHKPNS